MHARLAVPLVLALAVAPLSGCIGVANMDELRTRLQGDPGTVDLAGPEPAPGSPVAVIETSSSSVRTGETVLFDGSSSKAVDGRIDGWSWTVDGRTAADRPTFNWSFDAEGRHLVELTVSDGNATATARRQIQVAPDRPPTAVIGIRQDGDPVERVWAGETTTLSGEDSRDPEGTPLAYTWRLGDGTEATGETVEHTYRSPGEHTIDLEVADAVGQTATTNATLLVDDRGTADGQVTPSDETATVAVPVAPGATELAVTVDYEADLILEDVDLALRGPDGGTDTASDDEGPLPGSRTISVEVDDPAAGDWTAEIRLEMGDGADWSLTWTVRH